MAYPGRWHSVNLASCPKLESISLFIYFRASPDQKQPTDGPALCLAGAGMLARASATLRNITIRLHDLPKVTTLNNRQLLRLQAFDKEITRERFPRLKEVNLWIEPHRDLREKRKYNWEHVAAAARKALPQLHSRGVLKVRED